MHSSISIVWNLNYCHRFCAIFRLNNDSDVSSGGNQNNWLKSSPNNKSLVIFSHAHLGFIYIRDRSESQRLNRDISGLAQSSRTDHKCCYPGKMLSLRSSTKLVEMVAEHLNVVGP